jgi:hypothetical protein
MNLTSAAQRADAAMVTASAAGAALPIRTGVGVVDAREKSASPVRAS